MIIRQMSFIEDLLVANGAQGDSAKNGNLLKANLTLVLSGSLTTSTVYVTKFHITASFADQ
jgi:hypothetical protein